MSRSGRQQQRRRTSPASFQVIGLLLVVYCMCSSCVMIASSARTRGLGGGGGIRTVQCFHCIWYPNPELTSAKNASEICRQHSFKLPMIIESCELGCVVSAVHTTEEYKRVLGDRKKNLLSTYVTAAKSKGINLLGNNMVSLRRKPHENYSVNITLPPMEFFLRGCARSYHTGCIMDVSRPGVYHEDCFCHRDLCNGNLSSSNDSSIFVSSWMALVLHFVMRIVDGIVLKTRSRLNEKMVLNNNDASYGKEIPELKLLL